MANFAITDLAPFTSLSGSDYLLGVDVSDTTTVPADSAGSSKKLPVSLLLAQAQPALQPSGTDDTAAINAALASGGACKLAQATYYISAPITPTPGSALIGIQGGWGSANDFYVGGSGYPTGTIISVLPGFVGEAAILLDNETTTQNVGPLLRDFYLECANMPNQTANWSVSGKPYNGHGIAVYGYWGAGTMERVTVHRPQGVGFLFDSVVTGHPDNWVVRACKASAARGGASAVANGYNAYGFMVNWAPDCVFSDCESSENGSDNWFVTDNANGQFSNCKGENSYAGSGWHFQSGGAMASGAMIIISNCQSNGNAKHGFVFDTGNAHAACTYNLTGCKASNEGNSDNGGFVSGNYAGFMISGSPDRILLTGCMTDATLGTSTMKYGIGFSGTCWGALVSGGNYVGTGVTGFAAVNSSGATVTYLPVTTANTSNTVNSFA